MAKIPKGIWTKGMSPDKMQDHWGIGDGRNIRIVSQEEVDKRLDRILYPTPIDRIWSFLVSLFFKVVSRLTRIGDFTISLFSKLKW